MFAKFGTLLLIVISAVLLFSVTADAINVDYVGPESSYDYYLFAGSTQYSRAEFDEPYHTVYWYVKGPGETGLGTLVDTDYGDGTSTVSTFSHTFDSGSTSGEEYEITAYVYPENGEADSDSYTLGVWTPADEVITTPDELTITDDIKIGDSYSFNVDATSSSSNYVINEIEVFVDGISVASQSYDAVGSATITVSGNLPASAGDTMSVSANIKGGVKGGGKIILAILLKQVWRAMLRTTVSGDCECAVDNDPLDNKENLPFWCWVEEDSQGDWVKDDRFNTTTVEYKVLKVNNFFIRKSDDTTTNDAGWYIFPHKVPIGYLIDVTLKSDDMHFHAGNRVHPSICKYEHTEESVDTGNVILEVIPKDWDPDIQVTFSVNPDSIHDPCDDPYP